MLGARGSRPCAQTEDDVAAPMLCNVWKLLACGGVYVVISFRKQELLLALLSDDELGWTVERHEYLASAVGDESSICVLRKGGIGFAGGGAGGGEGGGSGGGAGGGGEVGSDVVAAGDRVAGDPPRREAVSKHVQRVLDWWYTQEEPLLTAEREERLVESWAQASISLRHAVSARTSTSPAADLPAADLPASVLPAGHLPMPLAFRVLFTEAEQAEIGYEAFVSDLAAFEAEHHHRGGSHGGQPEEGRPGPTQAQPANSDGAAMVIEGPAPGALLEHRGEHRTIDLDLALAYLKAEQ